MHIIYTFVAKFLWNLNNRQKI